MPVLPSEAQAGVSIRKDVKDDVEALLARRQHLTEAEFGFLMDLRGWIVAQGHSRLTAKQKERLAKIRTRVRGSVEDKG